MKRRWRSGKESEGWQGVHDGVGPQGRRRRRPLPRWMRRRGTRAEGAVNGEVDDMEGGGRGGGRRGRRQRATRLPRR